MPRAFANVAVHQKFKHGGTMYIKLRSGRKAMTTTGKIKTFADSTLVQRVNE